MSRELARWPAIAIALAPVFVSVFVGCTEDEPAASPIATGPVCPAQFADANGKVCNTEGQACDYAYSCPATNQQARCLCAPSGGELKYSCTGPGNDGPIKAGSNPTCVDLLANDPEACPASTGAANGAACSKAGLQCTYEGIECGGKTQLDFCFCRGTGGGALSFTCEPATCGNEGGLPPPPPPRDAATEGG